MSRRALFLAVSSAVACLLVILVISNRGRTDTGSSAAARGSESTRPGGHPTSPQGTVRSGLARGEQERGPRSRQELLASLDSSISAIKSALNKEVAAHEWVASLSRQDLKNLFDAWEQGQFPRMATSPELEKVLFRQFGITLGPSILNRLVGKTYEDRVARRPLRALCEGCARTDREGLITLARSLDDDDKFLAGEAGWGVFNSLTTQPFDDAIGHILRIQDLVKPSILGNRLNATWMGKTDDPDYGDNFQRMMTSGLSAEAVEGAARISLSRVVRDDVEKAIAIAEASVPHDPAGSIIRSLAIAAPVQSFPRVSEYLIGRLEAGDSGATNGLQSLGLRWGKEEPNAIGRLLPSIENENAYDTLTAGFVRAIWDVDRASAEAWLQTIKDEKWRNIAQGYR